MSARTKMQIVAFMVIIVMGAIILDDAVIKEDCIIAAGAVVTQNMVCESGYIYAGIPAKPVKKIGPDKIKYYIDGTASAYVEYSALYDDFNDFKK